MSCATTRKRSAYRLVNWAELVVPLTPAIVNVVDEELGQVIQLQGDQRLKISNFLIEEGIPKSTIKLHGF